MSLGENLSPLYQVNGGNMSLKGDFLGFTIGNIHSSALGIVRVSDSDRYNEDLTPTFTDKTAVVSGLDETYYFGADYTQKTFTIKFAFDHLLDSQLRQLKQIFSKKEPQDLIFDEVPYKIYSVKCSGIPRLNYLCFDEDYTIDNITKTRRVYKGDGTVNFVAYFPFARSRFKYLDDYTAANIPEWKANNDDNVGILSNKEEWKDSSGIINSNSQIEYSSQDIEEIDALYIIDNSSSISLYNQSDFSVSAKILIQFNDNLNDIDEITITLNDKDGEISNLTFDISKIKENGNIKGLVINSSTRLVHPLLSNLTTQWTVQDKRNYNNSKNWNYDKNIIYNQYIIAGDFFNIPICSLLDEVYINIEDGGHHLAIDYKYLYY